tara:strand:+ start:192 stop:494 length:303 start_codon:yes stop_codon:yes gene_type:complete
MRPEKLTEVDIQITLESLPGWTFDEGQQSLHRSFMFKNFSEAWGFMAQTALLAEKMDHHPDWRNSFNRVEVRLTTHDQGGVTLLDVSMAKAMEKILGLAV